MKLNKQSLDLSTTSIFKPLPWFIMQKCSEFFRQKPLKIFGFKKQMFKLASNSNFQLFFFSELQIAKALLNTQIPCFFPLLTKPLNAVDLCNG